MINANPRFIASISERSPGQRFEVTPEGIDVLRGTKPFQTLEVQEQDVLLDLLSDVLGGENDTSPAAVEKGLKKIAIMGNLKLSPPLKAAILSSLSVRDEAPEL